VVLSSILDPILNPLLTWGPFWTIVIISLFVSVFTTIIYKYTTNQENLRALKADMKRLQKKAKAYSKEGKADKAMQTQKDMMKLNGQYFKSSMRSTLYTFLPLIIFFGWLAAHLAFAPLAPGLDFSITTQTIPQASGDLTLTLPETLIASSNLTQTIYNNSARWTVQGPSGFYDLSIKHEGSGEEEFFSLIISDQHNYVEPVNKIKNSQVFQTIIVGNKKLKIFEGIFLFESIPWIKTWGWFGAYFLFSILFSTSLRKLMKLA
jgi:uncharacterized membrane protein (DUF106 family)